MDTDLESLSSRELHDMAIRHALHHMDVEFVWQLLRTIPAAEVVEGNPAEAGADLTKMSAIVSDALGTGEGAEADALRPLYIDYLTKHPAAVTEYETRHKHRHENEGQDDKQP